MNGSTAASRALITFGLACVISKAGGCSNDGRWKHGSDAGAATGAGRLSACGLMSKENVNAITGDSFSLADPNDDGHSSRSSCRYSAPLNPNDGVTLYVSWISARDYSDPAQHAALQHASIGGAQLGGKLTGGGAGSSMPGVRTGPVTGLGDEAYITSMTLSAREGDYTVMVQAMPNLSKLAKDSMLGIASEAHEKAIAAAVLSKLSITHL